MYVIMQEISIYLLKMQFWLVQLTFYSRRCSIYILLKSYDFKATNSTFDWLKNGTEAHEHEKNELEIEMEGNGWQ